MILPIAIPERRDPKSIERGATHPLPKDSRTDPQSQLNTERARVTVRTAIAHRRTRVLITVPHLHSAGSPYREMIGLVRFLPRELFDVTVATLRESQSEEARGILEGLGAHVVQVRFRPTGPGPAALVRTLSGWRSIRDLAPFDIQHSLDFSSSPIEAIDARLGRRKFVFNLRNMNENGHPWLLRSKIRLAHLVIAISKDTARLARAHGARREQVVTIHNGIEPELLAEGLEAGKQKQRTILCVGALIPGKRHSDAIRAFAQLLKTHPDLRLQLAGQPSYDVAHAHHLRITCESLGIASRVDFLGISRDVVPLMKSASVFLTCSQSEGVPWSVVEAMALRIPVVASDIPGHRELIVDGREGTLVPLGDIDGFATALGRLLDCRAVAESLVENGWRRIEAEFRADQMAAQTAEVYRSLTS